MHTIFLQAIFRLELCQENSKDMKMCVYMYLAIDEGERFCKC